MGKTWRNPELVVIFGAEDLSNPVSARGRVSANVDSDVEHGTLGDSDEFSLWALDLVVQPPEDAFGTAAVVILNEGNWITDSGIEKVLAKGLLKKAARIAVHFWLDADDVRYGQSGESHRSAGLVRSRMRYFPYPFFESGFASCSTFSAEIQPFRKAISSGQATLRP